MECFQGSYCFRVNCVPCRKRVQRYSFFPNYKTFSKENLKKFQRKFNLHSFSMCYNERFFAANGEQFSNLTKIIEILLHHIYKMRQENSEFKQISINLHSKNNIFDTKKRHDRPQHDRKNNGYRQG